MVSVSMLIYVTDASSGSDTVRLPLVPQLYRRRAFEEATCDDDWFYSSASSYLVPARRIYTRRLLVSQLAPQASLGFTEIVAREIPEPRKSHQQLANS